MWRNKMRKSIAHSLVILLLCIGSNMANAQNKPNPDSLFARARNAAFDHKDYTTAITYAREALTANSEYTDIVIFLGRIYAWKKMPDSARYFFEMALRQNPLSTDAYVAYADVELWNDNKTKSLQLLDKGLEHAPSSESLLIKKAKLLVLAREYDSALHVVNTILKIDNNTQARALANQIRDNISKNSIGLKYDHIHFDKQFPDPWQFISIDYTRQTKLGSVTARVNYANRFQTNGIQYELEAYPRISKTFYVYINVGYSSDNTVFPRWRAGASLYANLPKAFEAEIGLRYLYFTSDAFIYTIYIGKYYRSFLFGARTYIAPTLNKTTQTYSILLRYYYKGVDDYIGLEGGAGLSPDDGRVNIQLDNNYTLRTYRGELVFRYAIKRLNIIRANISLLNQEYRKGTVGNQIQVGIGYIRRF